MFFFLEERIFDDSVVCVSEFAVTLKAVRFIELFPVFGVLNPSSHLQLQELFPMNRENKELRRYRVFFTVYILSYQKNVLYPIGY